MENKHLEEKLEAYSMLGTAFLALKSHEAEAGLSYTDLPDLEVSPEISNRIKFLATTNNGFYQIGANKLFEQKKNALAIEFSEKEVPLIWTSIKKINSN